MVLRKMSEDFRKENSTNCNKAKEKLEQVLGFKFRVNTGCSYDSTYHKNIYVELVENDTDYKSLCIDYKTIERDMQNGKTFEQAVFDEFVFVLAHENNKLIHYKANIYEKLLCTYIRNVEVFPDGNLYYINEEHGLCKNIDSNNFLNGEIVNAEDISSLNFTDSSIYIGIKDGCCEEDEVCGYKIDREGWKKVYKDGSTSELMMAEPKLIEEPGEPLAKLRDLKPEMVIDKDILDKVMKPVDINNTIMPQVTIPYIKPRG